MTNISQNNPLYVLVPFTRNYSEKINGSKLARDLKLPQKTVFRKMESLVQEKILDFEREGRNKKYFINSSKKFTVLSLVENLKELCFSQLSPEVGLLLEELSKESSIVLFGSYAKGLAKKESDVDLVIFSENETKFKSLFSIYPFEINAHFVSLSQMEKRLKEKQALALEIKKDHILFGEKEKIIKLFIKYS